MNVKIRKRMFKNVKFEKEYHYKITFDIMMIIIIIILIIIIIIIIIVIVII